MNFLPNNAEWFVNSDIFSIDFGNIEILPIEDNPFNWFFLFFEINYILLLFIWSHVVVQSNSNSLWCTWLFRWKNLSERWWLRRFVSLIESIEDSEILSSDALRILLRCLKYESERKDARLQMLESKIIENDLIPILIHLSRKSDGKIINHALK